MTTLADLPGQLSSSWLEVRRLVGHILEPPYRTFGAIGSSLAAGDLWQLSRLDAIGIESRTALLRGLTERGHALLLDGLEQDTDGPVSAADALGAWEERRATAAGDDERSPARAHVGQLRKPRPGRPPPSAHDASIMATIPPLTLTESAPFAPT